jgi:transposase-like protein
VRTATPVERRPWSRHSGEGETADPGPDPARWRGYSSHAGQFQQATIHPIIEKTIAKGTLIQTDEYDIYARLEDWGYAHKTVCHAHGEYARDDDGDGFCEVHVNTIEGFWSLLRSWLRPHRGISQEKLPAYLGFFQFIHNARQRGKALLGALVAALVT